MKKLLFILSLILSFGCKNINYQKNYSKDLINFNIKDGIVSIQWNNIKNSKDLKLTVYRKNPKFNRYRKLKEINFSKKEFKIKHSYFETYDYKITVKNKNNKILLEKTIENIYSTSKRIQDLGYYKGKHLLICLPKSYENSNKRYPVIYLNDGQALCNSKYSLESMNLDKNLDLWHKEKGIGEFIVVGISSDDKRAENYLPYLSEKLKKSYGITKGDSLARSYANYIIKELIPYMDTNYRTIPNRDGRLILGMSHGAASSFFIAYNYSSYFSMGIALSPYLGIESKIAKEKYMLDKNKNIKLWFDIGTIEWKYLAPLFKDLSKESSYGKDFFYLEDYNADHTYSQWSKRLLYPLMIFSKVDFGNIKKIDLEIEKVYAKNDKANYKFMLNPIVEYENGFKYTLIDMSALKILSGNIEVKDDRAVIFSDNKNVNLKYDYLGFSATLSTNKNKILNK